MTVPDHGPGHPPLAALASVSKRFGPLQAVDDVSLEVHAGRVLALIGGNGAGKTTTMRMLAGLERPDEGTVSVGGRTAEFSSRRDAIRAGIGFIQQEFSLIGSLTCAENLLLGHPEHGFRIDRAEAASALRRLGDRFEVTLDPDRLVRTLSMGDRQQLEILIALSWGGRVVILDEPTSATGEAGLAFLRRALGVLRESGVGVVYISHKLPEVLELSDRIAVMRNGAIVWQGATAEASSEQLARAMVGEVVAVPSREERRPPGALALRLAGAGVRWSSEGRSLHEVDLVVHRHEILGIAGVAGNGQRELARLAAAIVEPDSGVAERPSAAGYVAEDRSRDSLALELSPTENAIVHAHRRPPVASRGLLHPGAARSFTAGLLSRFSIDPTVIDRATTARQLSGGNQQRLVLGRELEESTGLLVLHNPTRGLDIAATADLFRQLDEFCRLGGAAILISPDLQELLDWSDAIQVIVDGRLSRRIRPDLEEALAEIANRLAGVA
jgi:general nucleoside transport system ATP-binding protein